MQSGVYISKIILKSQICTSSEHLIQNILICCFFLLFHTNLDVTNYYYFDFDFTLLSN